MFNEAVTLLLIDDDIVDVKGIRRACAALQIANPLVVARDGVEALELLRGMDGRAPLPQPYVILLDLNMPRMNGLEFLQAMRQDERLREAVVFVLTTSDTERDKMAVAHLNVAGYIVKSDPVTSLSAVMSILERA